MRRNGTKFLVLEGIISMTLNLRERTEHSGIITQYNPIQRDMTVLGPDGKPVRGFDQSMIKYPLRVVLEIDSDVNTALKERVLRNFKFRLKKSGD